MQLHVIDILAAGRQSTQTGEVADLLAMVRNHGPSDTLDTLEAIVQAMGRIRRHRGVISGSAEMLADLDSARKAIEGAYDRSFPVKATTVSRMTDCDGCGEDEAGLAYCEGCCQAEPWKNQG